MSSSRAAGTEAPEHRTGGSALTCRTFVTAAALASAVPVATAGPAAARTPAPALTRPNRPARPVRHQPPAEPDFGPHVSVFGPDTPAAEIQAALDAAAAEQATDESGSARHTFLFMPGTYRVEAHLGPSTSLFGLGLRPDDVTLTGAVRVVDRARPGGGDGATANSWRSVENLALVPDDGVTHWPASPAASLRRVHIRGQLSLPAPDGGPAGGGYLADSAVDGPVVNASQQPWLTRDSAVAGWSTANPSPAAPSGTGLSAAAPSPANPSHSIGNQVFAGVEGAPAQSFPDPPHTTLPTGPLSREKPFLSVDSCGAYRVFLPALRHGGVGPGWADGRSHGFSVPLDRFFVARPSDSVRTLNKALSQGRHLLLTPGVYHLADTIRVKWAGTVVLGLGCATLVPQQGAAAMAVADARGVRIAGLLFDAGPVQSPVLLEVGARRGGRTDPREPASVQDVLLRTGGAGGGGAHTALVVNSDNVLLDHVRARRSDRGAEAATGPDDADAAGTGVAVNGDDVLATGLFTGRFPQHDVVWTGERGRTVMFHGELPHDLPDEAADSGAGGAGRAAYVVADSVRHHEVWGLSCSFTVDPAHRAACAVEAPERPGVVRHDVPAVPLSGDGVIDHVVDESGEPARGTVTVPVTVAG